MVNKSASEQLHNLLMQEDVGYKFTFDNLKTKISDADLEGISEGAITGFIHRAVRLGRVVCIGKAVGQYGRKQHQYEIVDRKPWSFKTKTIGSLKGRKIEERHYQEVPDTQNGDIGQVMKGIAKKMGVPVVNFSLSNNEPEGIKSICMRLFNLAAEVEALEKKSLKDYTSDELINELKRRIK